MRLSLKKMKTKFVALLMGVTLLSYSQVKYEVGYFISNDGQRTECLIKNRDWKNNPVDFAYRFSESDEPKTGLIENVIEFGLKDQSKFRRFTVDIDRSSDLIDQLDKNRNPKWSKESVYLKILVTGSASLYSYVDPNIIRFFYSIGDGQVQQLVSKRYKNENGDMMINSSFRQQLWTDVKCGSDDLNSVSDLEYRVNNLVHYFSKYNLCMGSDFKVQAIKQLHFKLKVVPGLDFSKADYSSSPKYFDVDFGTKVGVRFGLEAELVLPFNNGRWGVLAEPVYHEFFKSATTKSGLNTMEIKYRVIEFPVGLRHYFFLNKSSNIFVNLHYVPALSWDFQSYIDKGDPQLIILYSRQSFSAGFGFGYKRATIEVRTYTGQELALAMPSTSKLVRTEILVGFKILGRMN